MTSSGPPSPLAPRHNRAPGMVGIAAFDHAGVQESRSYRHDSPGVPIRRWQGVEPASGFELFTQKHEVPGHCHWLIEQGKHTTAARLWQARPMIFRSRMGMKAVAHMPAAGNHRSRMTERISCQPRKATDAAYRGLLYETTQRRAGLPASMRSVEPGVSRRRCWRQGWPRWGPDSARFPPV